MYTSKDIARHTREYLANGGEISHVDNENEITHKTGINQLVYSDSGRPVLTGDIIRDRRDGNVTVTGWQVPRHAGSSGRVYVSRGKISGASDSYFPHVFGLEFINRIDR